MICGNLFVYECIQCMQARLDFVRMSEGVFIAAPL